MQTPRRTAHDPQLLARASVGAFRDAIASSPHALDAAQRSAVDALFVPPRHGYYLWGDVGRGKTWLAETYFDAIPTERRRRFHFHGFFRELQTQIIRERAPLDLSLAALIGDAQAVLFDEFHVHDVADGVYLAATLDHLLAAGVLILATSNYAPDRLMPDPVHHERFVPVIRRIHAELDVIHLGDGEDYRHHRAAAMGFGAGTWRSRTQTAAGTGRIQLDADGHSIRAEHIDADTAVFAFEELCDRPLGVLQYLWLAERFSTITLVAVPDLATVGRESLARFANLIEVLHDRDVQLHVSSPAEPARMLAAAEPPRDARRILSRLATLELA